jgi:hypothetical protein
MVKNVISTRLGTIESLGAKEFFRETFLTSRNFKELQGAARDSEEL